MLSGISNPTATGDAMPSEAATRAGPQGESMADSARQVLIVKLLKGGAGVHPYHRRCAQPSPVAG